MSASCYRVAFREWFGLYQAPADVLVALFEAKGETVSLADLMRAACIRTIGSLRVHVSDIRKALDGEAVDSDCDPTHQAFRPRVLGYRLTESGLSECRAALWKMGEELRRAS